MRKHLSIFLLSVCLLFAGLVGFVEPVRAHIIGAFQDFLLALDDREQQGKLQEALRDTEGKYSEAKKQKDEQEVLLESEQEAMLNHLLFYDTIAFDAYASFVFEETELVDVIASQEIMKRKLEQDQEELASLYNTYKQWEQTAQAVEGYFHLLQAIQRNQVMKEEMIDTFPNLPPSEKEAFASLLQAVWNQDMKEVDEFLIRDGEQISEQLTSLAKRGSTNQLHGIKANTWNENTTLQYLLQSDHVYIVYEKGRAHTILITQLQPHPTLPQAYYLEMEAGYLNGYPISFPLLKELNGLFVLRYDTLANEQTQKWLVTSQSNQVLLQPVSETGD